MSNEYRSREEKMGEDAVLMAYREYLKLKSLVDKGSLANPKKAGRSFIYIFSNPSFPHLYKVGKTNRSIEERLKELSSATGVPTPFVKVAWYEVNDCTVVEKTVHQMLRKYRQAKGRTHSEFFSADLKVIEECILKAVFNTGDSLGLNTQGVGRDRSVHMALAKQLETAKNEMKKLEWAPIYYAQIEAKRKAQRAELAREAEKRRQEKSREEERKKQEQALMAAKYWADKKSREAQLVEVNRLNHEKWLFVWVTSIFWSFISNSIFSSSQPGPNNHAAVILMIIILGSPIIFSYILKNFVGKNVESSGIQVLVLTLSGWVGLIIGLIGQ